MSKLTTPIETVEIAGQTLRFGRLTLGAAVELEDYLQTLPTPFEALESSKSLQHIDAEMRERLIQEKLQQLHFWPPDALNALANSQFLTSAKFGMAFLVAMITAYNSHISSTEAREIAAKANHGDFMTVHRIALGLNDPKAPAAGDPLPMPGVATGSPGAESSHG
jgi:hypothetical protein